MLICTKALEERKKRGTNSPVWWCSVLYSLQDILEKGLPKILRLSYIITFNTYAQTVFWARLPILSYRMRVPTRIYINSRASRCVPLNSVRQHAPCQRVGISMLAGRAVYACMAEQHALQCDRRCLIQLLPSHIPIMFERPFGRHSKIEYRRAAELAREQSYADSSRLACVYGKCGGWGTAALRLVCPNMRLWSG